MGQGRLRKVHPRLLPTMDAQPVAAQGGSRTCPTTCLLDGSPCCCHFAGWRAGLFADVNHHEGREHQSLDCLALVLYTGLDCHRLLQGAPSPRNKCSGVQLSAQGNPACGWLSHWLCSATYKILSNGLTVNLGVLSTSFEKYHMRSSLGTKP